MLEKLRFFGKYLLLLQKFLQLTPIYKINLSRNVKEIS